MTLYTRNLHVFMNERTNKRTYERMPVNAGTMVRLCIRRVWINDTENQMFLRFLLQYEEKANKTFTNTRIRQKRIKRKMIIICI